MSFLNQAHASESSSFRANQIKHRQHQNDFHPFMLSHPRHQPHHQQHLYNQKHTVSVLTTLSFADTCEYPSNIDSSRTFDRLQADQLNTLIPKICDNADGCGTDNNRDADICARDPDLLTATVGCAWCTSKNANTCDPEPSNQVTANDYFQCYSTTPESCGMYTIQSPCFCNLYLDKRNSLNIQYPNTQVASRMIPWISWY